MSLLSIAARVAEQSPGLPADAPPQVVSQQQQEGQQEQVGYVKHEKGKGYCVKSEKNSDWSGGCYPSEGEAKKRLNQVEMFKHMKKGAVTPEDIAHDLRLVAAQLANSKQPDVRVVLSDLRSIFGAVAQQRQADTDWDPEDLKDLERREGQQQQQADWEMTLKDPDGDEKIEIGPGDKQGQQECMSQEETAVSPPGWGGVVEHLEHAPGVESPEALAWFMKNKGDKPHTKPKHHHKGDE
jgi:hypothetical protein